VSARRRHSVLYELGWRRVALKHKRTVQARAGVTLSDAPETVWLSPAAGEASQRSFDDLLAHDAA
jgi:hypothetical protein